ncbi:hypothetical protein ACH4S8_44505 [Streptomyces sp. NPDC021080]|uniref:hypothetical protein n=1 Tax=Streptomyces sp. NPDC021080 TaxID=3365110 RepID=UPI003790F550
MPGFPGKHYHQCTLDDRASQSVDYVRSVRDEIERRVRGLLGDPGVPAQRGSGYLKIAARPGKTRAPFTESARPHGADGS